MKYEFETLTGKITIDHEKCKTCETHICVKVCPTKILKLDEKNLPVLAIDPEEAKRRECLEDLACEQECYLKGNKAVKAIFPLVGYEQEGYL